jgi:hypothetical protein
MLKAPLSSETHRKLREFSSAQREAAFHHLASNVFGLGEHVPTTAAFQHPETGEHHSIQEKVMGGQHYDPSDEQHAAVLHSMLQSGQLDKLAMMDTILGNSDRHPGNYMLTPGQGAQLHLIDNGLAMVGSSESRPVVPHYWGRAGKTAHPGGEPGEHKWMEASLHPEAARWVKSLDPEHLRNEMHTLGAPKEAQDEAVRRLTAVQKSVKKGRDRGDVFFAPFDEKESAVTFMTKPPPQIDAAGDLFVAGAQDRTA